MAQTTGNRPPWEWAYILLPSAALRLAATREDITAGIYKHSYTDGATGTFLETSEYARLKRQEHRREDVIRRLGDAMRDAIRAGAR